jgi:hypothetical protein
MYVWYMCGKIHAYIRTNVHANNIHVYIHTYMYTVGPDVKIYVSNFITNEVVRGTQEATYTRTYIRQLKYTHTHIYIQLAQMVRYMYLISSQMKLCVGLKRQGSNGDGKE